eukprot:TRINITY_DN54570_c0_g1_i1.p1 TRINITY_DN54570_c0_g1~~TRINITY_DN54570_c0_g1_i1.p1  ORF type:complete len:690 (-),score=167.55 TRINITY_DN54570_c0_g1_i1:57-2048(-)
MAKALPAMKPVVKKLAMKAKAVAKAPLATKAVGKAAAAKGAKAMRAAGTLDPNGVLRSTEKAANAALLIQERCNACHGRTVRDVIGSMSNGSRYRLPDLRYDLKHGRLELLKPGSSAGAPPVGKARADAPLAGKPLPPATLEEFFQFLQCQLRMEVREHTGKDISLDDKNVQAMWPDVEAFVTPNLGKTERWVPYHTVLGVHELFLVQSVHSRKEWTEKQKFIAMFIFRAHCKRDLFLKAQLPLMQKATFWQDPVKAFAPGGPMEKSILNYRRTTGEPLLTSCFRIIPPRVLKDDTENLVRSITNRSMKLIEVAEHAFSVVKDSKRSAGEKLHAISERVQHADGLGETWAKMLTVCIDLAYPKLKLLESQCEVGTGAATPLRCLLPKGGPSDNKQALSALLKIANTSKNASTKGFWAVLKKSEAAVREKFKQYPLICAQANTKEGNMSACTLQVQLCEYRQFRHSIARNKYGLPDDETMRCDPEQSTRMKPEDFLEFDKKRGSVTFECPKEGKKIPFEVSLKAGAGSRKVTERIACMCFQKLSTGASKEETAKFRDEIAKGYQGGEDVKDGSEAWSICRAQLSHSSPLVSFTVQAKDGSKFPFQTTKGAAGGCILQAERIARLCWEKLAAGAKKDVVLEYRDKLYKQLAASAAPAAKRQKTGA